MSGLYQDCEIIDCEQRSDEWIEARRGLLTASEMGPWLLDRKTKRALGARETMICKLVSRTAGGWEMPIRETEAMRRGTTIEPTAVAEFESATNKEVMAVGFCRSIHGLFGCSPDGLIAGENAGFEGKVPEGPTHVRYRRAGAVPDIYRFQIHGSMAVTGADAWWFQSYNPGMVPLRICVERDEFTERILAALVEFSAEFEAAIIEERDMWDAEFAGRHRN